MEDIKTDFKRSNFEELDRMEYKPLKRCRDVNPFEFYTERLDRRRLFKVTRM